jgi:hypothetical protein
MRVVQIVFVSFIVAQSLCAAPGVFEGEGDVGETKHAGSTEFDAARGSYTVVGGGANIWFTNDAFHFVWKKVSGDVDAGRRCCFPRGGRRSASQGLPARSPKLLSRIQPMLTRRCNGDGLTSLQYRMASNERTYEIQSGVSRPKRLRIEKRGRYVSMSIATGDGELHPAGGSFRIDLSDPFYVGLGVCAHNNERIEKAVFSNVELNTAPAPGLAKLICTLETVPLASKDRRVVWVTTNHIEAPNWSRDGASLLFNGRGASIGFQSLGASRK